MGLVHYWKTRLLMIMGAGLCWMIGLGVVNYLGFPAPGMRAAAIALQPNPAVAMGVVLVALVVACVVGLLAASTVRAGAGVFCAVFLLAAVSWHSGAMRDVLFVEPDATTYVKLAIETAALGLMVGVLELLVSWGVRSGKLPTDVSKDGFDPVSDGRNKTSDALLALLLTAAAYVLLTAFLIPTDDKKQVLAGAAVAAFAASWAVHHLIMPTVPSWPFWSGVILGATVSYGYASIAPGVPEVGFVDFGPARALPIDHASAGVAAAIAGYWYSRKVKQAELEGTANTETA